MKITYIHHSCFIVELNQYIFIFDYYKGTLPEFDSSKHIVVFSSHKHYDHFDRQIFHLLEPYSNVTYYLSKDIKMNIKYMERVGLPKSCYDLIHYVGKDESLNINSEIHLTTLASTDEGVAFLINYNDMIIYHAGDLNWWSWEGEPEEENDDMARRFQHEINKIKGMHIDIAFLPLDPRQEDRFWWGFDYFMKVTDTQYAFPMHFWEKPSVIEKLKSMEVSNNYKERIMTVDEEGKSFIL